MSELWPMCRLYYLGCCLHFLSREFLVILVNNIRSSGIRICQGFFVRGFQTVSLFVKDVEVFSSGPMYFVCQRVLWSRYWKVSSCTVCLLEVLVSKVFSDPFCCCCFVGLQFVGWFFQVLYACQSFGCQNIASCSLVWCVRGFKV